MGIPVMEMTLGTWQCWWHNTAILPLWFGFTNYFSILAWFEPRTATQLTLKFDCRIAVKLSIAARTRKHISVVNCDLGRGCNHLTFKADHFVLRLNIKTLSFSSNRAIVAVSMVAKEYWHQGLHSSVDLSIPTILRVGVQNPRRWVIKRFNLSSYEGDSNWQMDPQHLPLGIQPRPGCSP